MCCLPIYFLAHKEGILEPKLVNLQININLIEMYQQKMSPKSLKRASGIYTVKMFAIDHWDMVLIKILTPLKSGLQNYNP